MINQLQFSKMQLLSQATQLSKKGQIYQSQGNYDYAAQCYKKVVIIIQGIIKMYPNQKEKVQQLKSKLTKYQTKYHQMILKQKQKTLKNTIAGNRISKLGFPIQKIKQQQKVIPAFKAIKPVIKPVKQVQEMHKPLVQKRNPLQVRTQKAKMLKQIDPSIQNLIVQSSLTFSDIVGMQQIKSTLQQVIIRPRKRPDLYSGIRAPPKGILLYGPPGNGKTYICKALANQSACTFFALSASSVMNKLVGESQKMLRKIFQAAAKLSPSIIFIDQIDSILTQRSENQNQGSRRLKTQFLVLLDGISSAKSGEILVIGATNLPKQLDLAAKRRFNKLIYIGLPQRQTRQQLIKKNLQQVESQLSKSDISNISKKLQGYSASQITNIIKQVCMIPLRELTKSAFQKVNKNKLRKVSYSDFCQVIKQIPPLMTKQDLEKYKIKI